MAWGWERARMIFLLTQDKITFHVQVLIEDKVYTHGYGKGNK